MEVSTTMKDQTVYTRSSVYNLLNNKFIRVNDFEKVDKEQTKQNKWFKSRGLRILNYQTDVINKVKDSLNKQAVTVLAACPSAGKTITAIYIIEDYLKQNPSHKVLILAHGTTVLRTQFHSNIEDVYSTIKSDFDYKLVENYSEYDNNASINVCLPQTLNGKLLNKIDLLVVDEAHQFYFASMVKDIIKKVKPMKQLLLTGTPSIFIRNKYPIIPVTLNTIFDEGMVSDLFVEIATSSYNFGWGDFNKYNELKSEINFKEIETKKTLDNLIGKIVERLKNIKGNESALTPEWLPTLQKLHKTMFVCKSQQQARQVNNYFNNIHVKTALSISETDIDSLGIEKFKKDENCLILIVVGRGILGFNYPELVNVVDMTTSQNIDRIYQLMCRVIRKHPKCEKKLFFKIAPIELVEYYKYIMTAVLALSDETFYTKFDGKNSDKLTIPVEKCRRIGDDGINSKKKQIKFKPIEFKDLPAIELFKYVNQNKDSLLNLYVMASMRDVRAEFLRTKPNNYWTKENCIESAKKHPKISDWSKNDKGAYTSAQRNGWIEECTAHMIKQRKWTKEKVIENASEYKSITDWYKREKGAYDYAQRNGWMDICTAHMIKQRKWTKAKVIESAKNYHRINEWKKSDRCAYASAQFNGWLEECTAHMIKKTRWTKEKVFKSALKYDRSIDWQNCDASAYSLAQKNGWLNECTEHMLKPIEWTKENCLESALNYHKMTDWRRGKRGAYYAAKRNGWFEECTTHMIKH